MNKEEFKNISFIDKIQYLNSKLNEGQTVTKIREDIGIGEKALQKEIKANGYKYDNKTKQYIPNTETNTTDNKVVVLESNTNVLATNINDDMLKFYFENFDTFKAIIDKFNANTTSNTETNTNIIIDLIDDRHLKPTAKGIRINEFVYRDWQKFCDKQPYTKMDLISMALKEYMEKYDK